MSRSGLGHRTDAHLLREVLRRAVEPEIYENERKRFTSYFLTFPGGGRLELMHRPDIQRIPDSPSSREFFGYAHLGVELGSRAAVDALTQRLQGDGFPLLDGPRRPGDGSHESMVADPEGNRIVIAE